MLDCIFCKIVAGQIPTDKVFEDEHILAFLDINPVNPGHLLIIPKEHSNNLLEAKPEILQQLIVHVPKLARGMMAAVGADSFNLGVNTGHAAGQVIDHTHFHIIPRFAEDNHRLWGGQPYQNNEEMKKVAEEIRGSLEKSNQ